jgi:hypothetical protein
VALESRGWLWHDGSIFAPHSTMWLLGSDPWTNDLANFYERMCGRLQRNEQHGWMYSNAQDHRNLVEDTKSLVDALAVLLAAERA